MPIRITGMNSGLDTESIITELVKVKAEKKNSLIKAQTKLQWKQDAWKELNSKVYSFYSKSLSNMRLESDYLKKTTKVSNSGAATVITGANAVNGVQTLKVDQLAKCGYLTGAKLKGSKAYSGSTKLVDDMGVEAGSKIDLTVNGKTTSIEITADTTIDSFVSDLKGAGVNASFDATNQRFFISAKETGAGSDFSLTAGNEAGLAALKTMGLATAVAADSAEAAKYMKYLDATYNESTKTYTYSVKSDLSAIALEEARAKAKLVEEKEKELTENEAAQQKIIDECADKNVGFDLSSEDGLSAAIEAKKQAAEANNTRLTEIAAELENASEEEKVTLEEEKVALEEENAALAEEQKELENLKELKRKHADLKAEVTEASYYFEFEDDDVTVKATGDMVAKVEADAAFALSAINNTDVSSGATRIIGQDAKILLNGAEFESKTNTFSINGLTITANMETAEEFTITTEDDTDGIYNMIKDFLKEYNALINEMDSLYNAESIKGYEPLIDEEKEAMTEKEIEKWEEKIKKSILRKDSTLSTVASAMKSIMLQGVAMSDGSMMHLSDFGINTLGYFTAPENEKNAYHIDGDADDSATSGNADKLKTLIANDSKKVVDFFTSLSRELYSKVGDMMKKTAYSSSFTLYDDISMKDEYNDYKDKITKQEEAITDYEDRYYKKFSAMETALAKLQSKESAISGLLGM